MADRSTPFTIFTSLRFDPDLLSGLDASNISEHNPYYLLREHLSRLVTAATHFSFPTASLLAPDAFRNTLDSALWKHRSSTVDVFPTPLKLKVVLSPSDISVECSAVPPVDTAQLYPSAMPEPDHGVSWSVVLDDRPTSSCEWTMYKTSVRGVYDGARERTGIRYWSQPKEVVLWNTHGEVMEGSFTNIHLKKDGRWVTPRAEAGGLCGTARRWLLDQGIVEEGVVEVADVKVGDWVVLSNGVRGFWGAWVEGI